MLCQSACKIVATALLIYWTSESFCCIDTEERLCFSLAWVRHLCVVGPPDSGELHSTKSGELFCPETGKGGADNGDGELGVEFGSVIDNPPAKNRRMPSFMPSSTAGPVRPDTTVEAGLVIVFEGVLDTASRGDCDFLKTRFTMRSHLRFYCVRFKVSDWHWGKKKVSTYTAPISPCGQKAAIVIRSIWTLFGQ